MQTANPPGSTCTGPAKAAELRFTADLAGTFEHMHLIPLALKQVRRGQTGETGADDSYVRLFI